MPELPATEHRMGVSISIKNYGPISHGRVALKPLTLLVGPNSCGKTHVAAVLHSAVKAEEKRIDWDLDNRWSMKGGENWHRHDVMPKAILRDEAKRVYSGARGGAVVDSDICRHVAEVWSKSFNDELNRNSGVSYGNIKAGEDCFELEIATEINYGKFEYRSRQTELKTVDIGETNLKVRFKDYRSVDELKADQKICRDGKAIYVNVPSVCDERAVLDALRDGLDYRASPQLSRSIYFPAERSGLMLFMIGLLHEHSDSRKPTLDSGAPGSATDFLAWLPHHESGKSRFARMAEDFEDTALGGKIVVKFDSMVPPHISYVRGKMHVDISKASSSIKDIALFMAYLKHVAKSGDMIILEEPEINLHPSRQTLLARLIARMSAAGLHVVVSTHSPYFLEQLSHCVIGGSVRNDKGREVLPRDECLKIEDVAAYRFFPDGDGYMIKPVDITKDGIPQTEFLDTDENLYEELVRLRQAE